MSLRGITEKIFFMKMRRVNKNYSTAATIFRYGVVLALGIIILNSFYLTIQEMTENRGIIFTIAIIGFGILFSFFYYSGGEKFKKNFPPFVSLLMMTLGGIILVQIIVAGLEVFRSSGYLIMVMILFICYGIPRFSWRWGLGTSMIMTIWYIGVAALAVEEVGTFFQAVKVAIDNHGWLLFLVHITGLFVAKTRDSLFTRDSEQYNDLVSAHKKLQFSYETIQEDLYLAKSIQSNILPPKNIQLSGLEIKTYYIPLREISGDIYDIHEIESGRIRIFLADATGHGIQAALITMIIKSEYEKLKRDTLNPAELLIELNNNFILSYESLQNYFSCICLDIDFKQEQLLWSSAGHPDQMLIQKEKLITLSATGILAGDTYGINYGLQKFSFHVGDKIILFTDGLYERMNEEMERSLKEVIKNAVQSRRKYRVGDLFSSLLDTLERFQRDRGIDSHHDDITLIAVERTDQE